MAIHGNSEVVKRKLLKRDFINFFKMALNIINIFRRYPIFFIIGVSSFLLNLLLTFIFTESLHFWYMLSFVIATFITWTFSFIMNSLFTFSGHGKSGYVARYLGYLAIYGAIGLITFTLVYLLTTILGFYYLLSVALVGLLMSFFTFLINKRFVFCFKEN